MQIGFVHRPVGVEGYGLRVRLQGAPKVTNPYVLVVYSFNLRLRGATEKNSAASEEWLHIVPDISESVPDKGGNA